MSGEKIRAVNYSYSLEDEQHPYKFQKECLQLVDELKELKCEVVDSVRFGENFFCCGTTFLNKEDDFEQYHISSFAKDKPYENEAKNKINFLCSGRTIPEFCNDNGYKYEVVDCFSWTIPQCVGFYALCLQVYSDLSFGEFVECCKKGNDVNLNGLKILNPQNALNEVYALRNADEKYDLIKALS